MNQNFEPYKSMTPGKKVVELRKLANDFGKQPSDVDAFLAGLVDSCDCQSGFACCSESSPSSGIGECFRKLDSPVGAQSCRSSARIYCIKSAGATAGFSLCRWC